MHPPKEHQSDYWKLLPIVRASADFLAPAIRSIRDVVNIDARWRFDGIHVDVNAVSGPSKALLDDGDFPPEWCYLWLQTARAVAQLPTPIGTQAILHVPANALTVPLTVRDLCAELGGNAWKAEGAAFLIWGAEQTAFRKHAGPIKGRGVLVPTLDGLGLAWAATNEDAQQIGLPTESL